MRVVAYVPDLLDRSKVAAVVPGVRFVARPEELVDAEADLVLVDASRPGALDVVPTVPAPVVAFGPHVDRQLLAAAQAAGCRDVLPRSAFFRRLPELLPPGSA